MMQSLRFRLTALATLIVVVVLTVASVALFFIQRQQLINNLDASLGQQADLMVASLLEAEDDGGEEHEAVELDDLIATVDRLPDDELFEYRRIEIRPQNQTPFNDADEDLRWVSRPLGQVEGQGPAVLYVGESTEEIDETVRGLVVALLVTIPLVAAILAALLWWLTGRALNPVDSIRSQVDAISDTNSPRRIELGADTTQRHDEITRLAATMNGMLDRLHEAGERQRRFVADAAHELRTPLTRIRTTVEVDLQQPDRADRDATSREVRDEAVGLQRMIDDLLLLARSDDGTTPSPMKPLDLDDLVLQEIRDQRATMEAAPITIDASAVSAAHLIGNAEQLARAFRNLLTNAVRHASSTVRVELSEDDDAVHLAISDDGPGVPAEQRELIFERFTRLDDARARDDGGTGLGLAITREIVTEHGGSITCVVDGRSTGARFEVTLPTSQT